MYSCYLNMLRHFEYANETFSVVTQVTDLHDETKYEFRVVAENEIGKSHPSGASDQITTKNPWSECCHLVSE